MYERFTDRARKAMSLANEHAKSMGHENIGTEHILLGIVTDTNCVASVALESLGIHRLRVSEEVEKLLKPNDEQIVMGKLPLTPSAKVSLEQAIVEAKSMRHNYVGTEHLLLGLMYDEARIAGHVLKTMGLTRDSVRKAVCDLIGQVAKDAPELIGAVVTAYGEYLPIGVCGEAGARRSSQARNLSIT